MSYFDSTFSESIYRQKYAQEGEDWPDTAARVAFNVMDSVGLAEGEEARRILALMIDKQFIPGGRYLYASGRDLHQVSNCALYIAEDTREGWADLTKKVTMSLMTGAGIGTWYGDVRPSDSVISRTGGVASGPLSLMKIVNEVGRNVMQGGSRRCLPGDSMVTMGDCSQKPIRDVVVGDFVATRFGPKVVEAWESAGEKPIIRIDTERGSVRSSEEHRWLGANSARTKSWIRGRNFSVSHKLYRHPVPVKNPAGSPSTEDSSIPTAVTGVAREAAEEVYDIQVEGEEFIADGFVSHNSAIWAGLPWWHADVFDFIRAKDWSPEVRALKEQDFAFPAQLDMTNISVSLDDDFFDAYNDTNDMFWINDSAYAPGGAEWHDWAVKVYDLVVSKMLTTAEPGFTVDVGDNAGEFARNACTEISSYSDSDICNIGSLNMSRFGTKDQFAAAVRYATLFLISGSVYSDLPHAEIHAVRERNRRLGLGLMGVHEWLLKRGKRYGPDEELGEWLEEYARSTEYAHEWADQLGLSRPVKTRALAPTGTIGIIAETTTSAEPIFAAAYKRRVRQSSSKGDRTVFEYVVDPTAARLVAQGVDPALIEDAYTLSYDVERRVAFQAWLQQYVDHGISSTVNLPGVISNPSEQREFGDMLMQYLPSLRGITAYPDGSRGGQPLTSVPLEYALGKTGVVFEGHEDSCVGGQCGT